MFKKLRKYCKWHQKQIKIGGEWKYETRLVAWYGVNIFGLLLLLLTGHEMTCPADPTTIFEALMYK